MTKKALLIGINYLNTNSQLNGCINDVQNIRKLLLSKFEYSYDNITLLTDNTDIKPTKENILSSLHNLIDNSLPEDKLCFYYSGHGTNVKNLTNIELDGFDEALYTLDKQIIIDDEILLALIKLNGASITMFFDCCHSGTICDLAYNLRYKGVTIATKPIYDIWNETSKKIKGNVSMFAGCLDKQTSADSSFSKFDNEYEYNGAFTYMLLFILEKKELNITNRQLLIDLYNNLNTHGYTQVPQFSCSDMKMLDDIFNL
jgi:hypothetical protein